VLWILNFSFLELLKFMLKNKTNPNYEVSPFFLQETEISIIFLFMELDESISYFSSMLKVFSNK